MADGADEQPKKIIPDPPPDGMGFGAPGDAGDDKALREARQLSSGKSEKELIDEARKRDHDRGEKFKDNFETLSIYAMWGLFAVMSILGVIWLLHMILPERCVSSGWFKYFCRWLTPDQTIVMQNIITGGLVAGIVTDHFKRRLGR